MASIPTFYNGLTRQGNVSLTVETTTKTLADYANDIATAEGLNLNYYIVSLARDPRFNSISYPSQTFSQIETALGITLVSGDIFISTPFQDGLTKQQKQVQKLDIAQVRRQAGGDTTQQYYRAGNIYDLTSLPDTYNGNAYDPDDNPNTGGLIEGRPWIGVAAVAAPTSIAESVPAATLLELESWYDASDGSSFTPNNPADGDTFTQWADKSAFAHNANPHGGATTRPTVQTNELNAYPVVRFDGVNDGLTINPYTGLVNAAAVTVFAVAKLTATAGYPKLFGQAQSFDMFYSTDTNSWRFNIFGQSATSTGANDNAWHIHTVAFDGSQGTNATKFRYRRDKTANTLSFSGTVPTQIGSTSQLDIGFYDIGTTQFMQGDIAEFLIFTKVLTDNEIANVENYLSNKWGL
jgi:hypothetical protein